METIFTKIIQGSIPSAQLYSDEMCIAILDIAPVNKGHALVISREPYPTIASCPHNSFSHMMGIARTLSIRMREILKADGINIIVNDGPAAGQEVPHLHIHVIPRYNGDAKTIIPNKERYEGEEMARYKKLLAINR